MRRRQYLGSVAGLGALAALPTAAADTETRTTTYSHHPGPPRVIHAGEQIVDPPRADYKGDSSPDERDLLAPRVPDPERDPENYPADAFSWRVVDTPDGSEVDSLYTTPDEYDYGAGAVEEFDPDVPGTYRLELDAPDGTHELTVRVYPDPPADAAGPPRVRPTVEYDGAAGEFVVAANPAVAPDSGSAPEELTVEFLTDDRDGLSEGDVTVDGATATVPESAVDGQARLHAVAVDDRPSVVGTVELDAESGSGGSLNAPPEWLKDATMYEIFTRSFGSEAGEVDFSYLQSRVDYLADLGIDVVWLTPIVDAGTHREENPVGGPHGYDTLDYFDTADELGTVEAYEAFVDACHERDIKVCFDLVINHTDIDHRFFQEGQSGGPDSKYYEWYERLEGGEPANYFSWSDLMNVNYEWVAAREHILAAVDFWAERVDGFRCDVGYGVPHGFWKEVRERVKAIDSDCFLLDETIPYMRRFSEQEFDQHFDDILYETLVDVGQGLEASAIYDAVRERSATGVPDRTVFLQYLENHDLPRYLDSVDKEAERAAAAATFTLPGAPMIYYGQERALAEYSDSRVTDQGHARAFMNWEEYDEDHLAFYESLISAREEIPALQHDAEMVGAYYDSDSENVVAYGRDAGDQKVVVVLNFGEGTETVDLRGAVSTTDLISGSDVGADGDGDTTRVTVDAVAVLETPSLSGLGTHVTGIEDGAGADDRYDPPTEAAPGAFDMTRLDVHESERAYQLRFSFDGPIENPRGYDGRFSSQHLQVYLRDPTTPDGSRAAREGVGATLSDPYQYRVVADGENGARVETPDGDVLAEGSVFASASTRAIRVDVPKHAIEGDLAEKQLAPLVLGYDPDAPGGVMGVGASAGERQFGGGADGDSPITDLFVPEDRTQDAVLGGEDVEIPYVLLTNPLDGELIAEFEDATGDDTGPGSYTYPTDDAIPDGAFDIGAFDIYDTGDRYRFVYEMAGDLTNPYDGGHGFSLQHLQVYLASPAADGSTGTEGREGTNVAFESPYDYRVVASGHAGQSVVEDGAGSVVTEDVAVGAYRSIDVVTVSVPKSAVGGDLSGASVAPLVFGADAEGAIRPVEATATETAFGGGGDGDDPAVIDMVVPGSADQSSVLDSGEALPMLPLSTFSGTRIKHWEDASGDDHGPGSYEYPSADILGPGVFDISEVELYRTGDRYRFVYYMNSEITNPWSGAQGFSLYYFHVYLRDPEAGSDVPATTAGRDGTNTQFQQPYHYRVAVTGYSMQAVETADGSIVSEDVGTEVYPDLQAVAFDFPTDALGGDIERMQFAPLVFGYDGFASGKVRAVNAEPAEWTLGGGRDDTMNTNAIDMITPEGVSQSEAMSFSADSQSTLPFVPQRSGPAGPFAAAGDDRTAFGTTEVTLDASGSSHPENATLTYEWTQTGGSSVDLSDPATVDPTFTAPGVDSETDLTFEVTVTDEAGQSATASTTVTVVPQSANAGPEAVAGLTDGFSRPVEPGAIFSVDAYDSTDPNGGSLGYQWTQTGGPSVDLSGADSSKPTVVVPESVGQATLVFEVTVDDGQGKTDTDTVEVPVEPAGSAANATDEETDDGTTAAGDGPGFGVVSGVLGTAAGGAYAARSLFGEDGAPEARSAADLDDAETDGDAE